MTKIIQKFNPLSGQFNQVTTELDANKVPVTPSGNLTSTNAQAALVELQNDVDSRIPSSEKGANNGVATLDGSGKVPANQLPNTVMEFKGTWNASTNTPTLVDGVGNVGDVYIVSVAGTQNLGSGNISFEVRDYAVYDGSIWNKSDASDAVTSVFGRQGAISAQSGDYTASQITNTPSGNLIATDVQAALNELQSDVDTRATASALSAHTGASSGVHGVTGSVVGTSDSQTLINKTIDADLNTILDIADGNIKSGANIAGSKINPTFTTALSAPGITNSGQSVIQVTTVNGTGSLVFDMTGDTSTRLVVYLTTNGDSLTLPAATQTGRVITVILSATSSGVPVSLLITAPSTFGLDGSPSTFLLESAFQSVTFVAANNTWYLL